MEALRIDKSSSVLVTDDTHEAWVDVWINESGEVECDWNKYIFHLPWDSGIRDWQDDCNNFTEATELAVSVLEAYGLLSVGDGDKYTLTTPDTAIDLTVKNKTA